MVQPPASDFVFELSFMYRALNLWARVTIAGVLLSGCLLYGHITGYCVYVTRRWNVDMYIVVAALRYSARISQAVESSESSVAI